MVVILLVYYHYPRGTLTNNTLTILMGICTGPIIIMSIPCTSITTKEAAKISLGTSGVLAEKGWYEAP